MAQHTSLTGRLTLIRRGADRSLHFVEIVGEGETLLGATKGDPRGLLDLHFSGQQGLSPSRLYFYSGDATRRYLLGRYPGLELLNGDAAAASERVVDVFLREPSGGLSGLRVSSGAFEAELRCATDLASGSGVEALLSLAKQLASLELHRLGPGGSEAERFLESGWEVFRALK